MATTLIKLSTTICILLLILLHPYAASAFSTNTDDREDYISIDTDNGEDYIVDTESLQGPHNARRLFQPKRIKKGARCAPQNNICNGVPVNKGTGLLQCCKNHCRNVLSDRNHCGRCGRKCSFGQLCCSGVCTNVAYNASHCGKCNVKCSSGLQCEFGACGYA